MILSCLVTNKTEKELSVPPASCHGLGQKKEKLAWGRESGHLPEAAGARVCLRGPRGVQSARGQAGRAGQCAKKGPGSAFVLSTAERIC